jgi:hypothetical protein
MTRAKGKHRQCSTCRLTKPLAEFYRSNDPRDPDGRLRTCASCSKDRANITNRALRILRDRHRDEYLAIRQDLSTGVMHTTDEGDPT